MERYVLKKSSSDHPPEYQPEEEEKKRITKQTTNQSDFQPEYHPNEVQIEKNEINWEYLSPEFLYVILTGRSIAIYPFEYEKTVKPLLDLLQNFFHVTPLDLRGFSTIDLLKNFLEEFHPDLEKLPPFFFLTNATEHYLQVYADAGLGCLAIQTSISEESQLKTITIPQAFMWYNKKTHVFHPFLTIDMSDSLMKWIKNELFRVKDLPTMQAYAQNFMLKMKEFLRISVNFSLDAYHTAFPDWTPVEHATAKFFAETFYKISPDIIPPQIDKILTELETKSPSNPSPIQEIKTEMAVPKVQKASRPRKKKEPQIQPEKKSNASISLKESPLQDSDIQQTNGSLISSSPSPAMSSEEMGYLTEYSRFQAHPTICRAFNVAFQTFTDPAIDPTITSPEEKYLIARKTVLKDHVPLSFVLQIYFPLLNDQFRGKKQLLSKGEAHTLARQLWEDVVSALSPLATNLTFSEADIAPILQTMTKEGLISDTEIEHYDDIDQFVQEIDPSSPSQTKAAPKLTSEPKLTFRQMVDRKARELEKEFPIYDPDIEAKLDAHIEKLMQQLEALHDDS